MTKKHKKRGLKRVPMKKRPKVTNIMGMSPKDSVRTTRLLEEFRQKLRHDGVIHWHHEMGMKKLKEMFPDVYGKEKDEGRLYIGTL